ncbi:MAG: HIT domain-containing protein [Vicinamibacteria bacterium]|nr:HIT domain-containing protein [Vicinamibacteria bacterium]
MTDCPFCHPERERIAFEDRLTRAIWDGFPVSPGHLLLVPRRHVPTWFDAADEERAALLANIDRARDLLSERADQPRPDGYNIGINVGRAAGQTVFHLHVHVIPRYEGDVPDPRGGVRHVIPGKGNYLARAAASASATPAGPGAPDGGSGAEERPFATEPPRARASGFAWREPPDGSTPRLVTGGEADPLLPYLAREFAASDAADIAVGFVMGSGVERLVSHLREFLDRGARLRLLTGDYLDVTDPDALVRLLDLEGDRQLRVFETRRAEGLHTHPRPEPALSFHPKSYLFQRREGTGVAFVGSSNLSESALLTGIEWNYRTVSSAEGNAFSEVRTAFEQLFHHPATRELTPDWVERYRARRKVTEQAPRPAIVDIAIEPRDVPQPHAIQPDIELTKIVRGRLQRSGRSSMCSCSVSSKPLQ